MTIHNNFVNHKALPFVILGILQLEYMVLKEYFSLNNTF